MISTLLVLDDCGFYTCWFWMTVASTHVSFGSLWLLHMLVLDHGSFYTVSFG